MTHEKKGYFAIDPIGVSYIPYNIETFICYTLYITSITYHCPFLIYLTNLLNGHFKRLCETLKVSMAEL